MGCVLGYGGVTPTHEYDAHPGYLTSRICNGTVRVVVFLPTWSVTLMETLKEPALCKGTSRRSGTNCTSLEMSLASAWSGLGDKGLSRSSKITISTVTDPRSSFWGSRLKPTTMALTYKICPTAPMAAVGVWA